MSKVGANGDDSAVDCRGELSQEDLAEAFDTFGPPILRYLNRRAGSGGSSEDLLSVVFLEAWRTRAGAFRVDSSLAPWLYGIARNVLRGQRRATWRHRAALERYSAMYGSGETNVGELDELINRVDAASASAAVADALACLSAKDRDVAEICLVEGLSVRQAAATLGIPQGTVQSRLAHARASLRAILQSGDSEIFADQRRRGGHEVIGSASRSERKLTI